MGKQGVTQGYVGAHRGCLACMISCISASSTRTFISASPCLTSLQLNCPSLHTHTHARTPVCAFGHTHILSALLITAHAHSYSMRLLLSGAHRLRSNCSKKSYKSPPPSAPDEATARASNACMRKPCSCGMSYGIRHRFSMCAAVRSAAQLAHPLRCELRRRP
jgi:hypothetical protein